MIRSASQSISIDSVSRIVLVNKINHSSLRQQILINTGLFAFLATVAQLHDLKKFSSKRVAIAGAIGFSIGIVIGSDRKKETVLFNNYRLQ
jgi:hypothetical protein